MQINVLTKNDICEKVLVEFSTIEWLIANKAIKQFIKNPSNHHEDIQIAEKMNAAEPNFTEIADKE